MSLALRQLAVLIAKDLRIEARAKQTIGLVTVLGILILVVLGLGLGQSVNDATGWNRQASGSTAVLWVAFLFGGVLVFEKTMAVERNDAALAGLLLAPVDRSILYAAKLIANLILIFALVVVITLVAVVLLRFDLSQAWGAFVVITALSMVGFAAVGTLFSAATSSSRLQGGLLALLIFPICLPLVITSTQLMVRALGPAGSQASLGIAVLLAFDAVYLVVSWLVFELLLEP